jgi:hypothetical protein
MTVQTNNAPHIRFATDVAGKIKSTFSYKEQNEFLKLVKEILIEERTKEHAVIYVKMEEANLLTKELLNI